MDSVRIKTDICVWCVIYEILLREVNLKINLVSFLMKYIFLFLLLFPLQL